MTIANTLPSGVVSRFVYTYDAVGQRTGVTTLDGTWTYEYDEIGQLIRAAFASTNASIPHQELQYFYDGVGNRIRTVENGVTTDYTTNSLNQYVRAGNATYIFDTDGNLVQETDPDGVTTYSYDMENRLVGVTKGDDSWQYVYDALGNRVAATENGATTNYFIDPIGLGNVVGEYDAAGALIARYDHVGGYYLAPPQG